MRPYQPLSRPSGSILTAVVTLAVSFSLVACGGGGGNGDNEGEQTIQILSTPTLDGPVAVTPGSDATQRPDVGDTFSNDFQHALFSFDLGQIPDNAKVISAELSLTSTGTNGNPSQMMGGRMVIDQLNFGSTFPTVLSEVSTIVQSGIAIWDNVSTLGTRTFDVSDRVRADRVAGRPRSQYQVRGLVSTNSNGVLDMVSLSGAETTGFPVPMLTVVFE